jgi:hypothetical protein
MGLTKKLNKVEDLVFRHLKDHDVCRDNTKFLYYSVLQEFYRATSPKGRLCEEDKFLSDLYDLLHYAPCDESIQRSRRKIQNKLKMHQSSKAVRDMRQKAEETYYTWSVED